MEKSISLTFTEYKSALTALAGSFIQDIYHMQDTTFCFDIKSSATNQQSRILVLGWWHIYQNDTKIGTSDITQDEEADHHLYYERLREIAQKLKKKVNVITTIEANEEKVVLYFDCDIRMEVRKAKTGFVSIENLFENSYTLFVTTPKQRIFKAFTK